MRCKKGVLLLLFRNLYLNAPARSLKFQRLDLGGTKSANRLQPASISYQDFGATTKGTTVHRASGEARNGANVKAERFPRLNRGSIECSPTVLRQVNSRMFKSKLTVNQNVVVRQERIFNVRPNAYFRLSAVDLNHGNALHGGLIKAINGAGMEFSNVEFSNGVAWDGGAIFARNTSSHLSQCTLRDNLATRTGGAFHGFYLGTWCENCTFTGNHADISGGAIFLDPYSNISGASMSNVMSCTIVNNSTGLPGFSDGAGAGIAYDSFDDFRLFLYNSIVADNDQFSSGGTVEPNDLHCNPFQSAGNFIGFADPQSNVTDGVNGNQIGTINQPLNPRLYPLAFNGGRTQNHFPRWNSPVINAGEDEFVDGTSPFGLTIDVDQRNKARIRGSHVDIGSVER